VITISLFTVENNYNVCYAGPYTAVLRHSLVVLETMLFDNFRQPSSQIWGFEESGRGVGL